MTNPQEPGNNRPTSRAHPGDHPSGQPPAPAGPFSELLNPREPGDGGDGGAAETQRVPSAAPLPETDQPAASNAETRRIPATSPRPAGARRTTPVAKPADPPTGANKKKHSLRDPLALLLVAIIVVSLAVAGLIGGELYARKKANGKVAAATECVVQDGATASFGVTPLVLWQVATSHYTNISVETAGNQIRDAKGMKVRLDIRDVKLDDAPGAQGTMGALDATVTWTAAGIKETIQNAIPILGEFVTNNVITHPKDGTIELKGFLDDIVAKPVVSGGTLKLQIVTFNTLGFLLPKEAVQSAIDAFISGLQKDLPLDIEADSVQVTDAGVVSKFSTVNATIPTGQADPCFAGL
ncbi:LmeA family phospholipid-binding protein [Mycobacterium sp.]|uniref:LmeA family phospholipid-binding protein n=1 Tax=Mycobacterium sp. TaxID=1785 RepID=UPI003A85DC79